MKNKANRTDSVEESEVRSRANERQQVFQFLRNFEVKFVYSQIKSEIFEE